MEIKASAATRATGRRGGRGEGEAEDDGVMVRRSERVGCIHCDLLFLGLVIVDVIVESGYSSRGSGYSML